MKKAVIFDIDGTLVDSVDFHARAWQQAFKAFGVAVDFTATREQIGKGSDKLLPVFLSTDEIERQGDAIVKHREEIFQRSFRPLVKPFSGVRKLFEAILGAGMQVALASSAKAEDVAFYIRLLQVDDLPIVESSSEDVKESKPEPDIFEAALRRLQGLRPSDVIVVGDTPHDAEAAAKAGMLIIGVLCGGVSETVLRDSGCCEIYCGPADLLMRFENSSIVRPSARGTTT